MWDFPEIKLSYKAWKKIEEIDSKPVDHDMIERLKKKFKEFEDSHEFEIKEITDEFS